MNDLLPIKQYSILSDTDVHSAVENALNDLKKTNDIESAVAAVNTLDHLDRVSGLGKAHLLHGIHAWWYATHQDQERGESFESFMEASTDNKSTVIGRYVVTWEHLGDMPKEIRKWPIRKLIPIAITLEQGYDLDSDQWGKIKIAANESEIGDILREVKGKPMRKHGKRIYWKPDGSLVAYKGNVLYHIGYMDRVGYEDSEDVRKIVDGILADARITKQ